MADCPSASCSPSDYDAGLLNDFGGGDVGWWQDYLRAEIGRANDYWREIHGQRCDFCGEVPLTNKEQNHDEKTRGKTARIGTEKG